MAELDAATLAAMQARHVAVPWFWPDSTEPLRCRHCRESWPCDAEVLRAEVARLRAFVRRWCPDDWHGGQRYREEAAGLGIVLD